VITLRYSLVQPRISSDATIESAETIAIRSTTGGTIARILVEKNEPVHSGQIIAELDHTALDHELANARIEVESALQLMHVAKLEYETLLKNPPELEEFQCGPSEQNDCNLTALREKLDLSVLRVTSSFDKLNKIEAGIEQHFVRSGVSGSIATLEVQSGSSVSTDAIIAQIATDTDLAVVLQVAEKKVRDNPPLRSATITPSQYTGSSTIDGKVTRIGPCHEANCQIRIEFRNPGPICSGMNAHIELNLGEQRPALTVPENALMLLDDTNASILRVANGKLETRPVETEEISPGLYEIKSGGYDGMAVLLNAAGK
jgi:RND family efflux transporter MFP subunit